MQKTFFTAGPSQLFPTFSTHIQAAIAQNIGSISHRSTAYKVLHQKTSEGLKHLWNIPAEYDILFFASATEIWERLLQNCVSEMSFHFVNGAFSQRFAQIASELHKNYLIRSADWGKGFDFDSTGIPESVALLNFTHNESSTGVMQPLETVYAYKKVFPNALITVDVVSSAPYPEIDFSQIDATYFSVQKGFGLPAGLGVLIASPRLIEKARQMEVKNNVTGSYHRLTEMHKKSLQYQTVETPNVWNIFLLGEVVEEMLQQGIDNIRRATKQKAEMLYQTLSELPVFDLYVKEPEFRSQTVITADTKIPSADIIAQLSPKGFIIGDGYDKNKGKQIRIANFPAHSVEIVAELCNTLRTIDS
jgi:phosphoserine aminotransferase